MKELGVAAVAAKVAPKKPTKTATKRKPTEPATPSRKSSRARKEVSYKEPSMAEFEQAVAVLGSSERERDAAKDFFAKESKSGYDPKPPGASVKPALDLSEGVRDKKTGHLVFEDHPEFTPNLTPRQVIQAGTWGGCYFHPRGGKPGVKNPKEGVKITHEEFPKAWFAGLKPEQYRNRRYDKTKNKYGVNAGQDQAYWEEKGWIIPQDPRGWFQWYCRFYEGRRTADDARQISRWVGVAGGKGRWKTNLCKKCVYANKRYDDPSVSPVVRQTMLHWAYEITEADVKGVMKRM
jgi:hypothetical protein